MELLFYTFIQRALLAGLLVAVLSAAVSFFVLLKRLAFIGNGIAHAALGGIALGLVTGLNPLFTAGLLATGSAWVIGGLSRKGRLPEDTAIGIVFTVAMALGIMVLNFYKGYVDVFSYLFGNILTVSWPELRFLSAVTVIVILFLGFYFHDLLALTFDEETAEATGIPVAPLYFVLLTLLALTVIVAAKVVGILLTSALIILPAATGYQLARNYRLLLLYSFITSLLAVLGGIALSVYLNLPSGASIVLTHSLIFALAFLYGQYVRSKAG
ncbi:MAG: metal ABC transporter permease [Moorellaceae bacterium]